MMVYLVDDDPSVRKALARLFALRAMPSRPSASALEFIGFKPETTEVACLVLDVPCRASTVWISKALRVSGGRIRLSLITGHGDIPVSVRR
jgi:FixJ family two-component response regulator